MHMAVKCTVLSVVIWRVVLGCFRDDLFSIGRRQLILSESLRLCGVALSYFTVKVEYISILELPTSISKSLSIAP